MNAIYKGMRHRLCNIIAPKPAQVTRGNKRVRYIGLYKQKKIKFTEGPPPYMSPHRRIIAVSVSDPGKICGNVRSRLGIWTRTMPDHDAGPLSTLRLLLAKTPMVTR